MAVVPSSESLGLSEMKMQASGEPIQHPFSQPDWDGTVHMGTYTSSYHDTCCVYSRLARLCRNQHWTGPVRTSLTSAQELFSRRGRHARARCALLGGAAPCAGDLFCKVSVLLPLVYMLNNSAERGARFPGPLCRLTSSNCQASDLETAVLPDGML